MTREWDTYQDMRRALPLSVSRRSRWAILAAWFRWRLRRPDPFAYHGDWPRFHRDLERWRARRP